MSAILLQCDRCHRIYAIDAVTGRLICPTCRAQTSQEIIIRLPVEVV